ncbi:MAG: hypothetical protein ACI8W8_004214 [Rhodothermales bacterium]|jgi:hypothetical protein
MPETLRLSRWLLLLGALCCGGCLEYEDHLAIAADGSGTWSYNVLLGPQLAGILQSEDGKGKLQIAGDSTMAESEFRDEVDDIPGAEVTQFETQLEGEQLRVTAAIRFTDLKPVVEGDVGRTMGWGFTRDGNELLVTAMTTLSALDTSRGIQIGGKDGDFNMIKAMLSGARIAKTLTLPSPISDGNADCTEGATATWEMAITEALTEPEFARMKTFQPRVRCAIAEFAPSLPLLPPAKDPEPTPKNDLTAAEAEDKPPAIIEAKGLKFEPVSLQIVRTRHYQRAGSMIGNPESYLRFEMTWPKNLQPSGYSSLQATKIIDDTDRELASPLAFHTDSKRSLAYVQNKARTAQFDLRLEAPSSKAARIHVSGTMLLHVPIGLQAVRLPLPAQGAKIEAAELAEFELHMDRIEGNSFSLKSTKNLEHIVKIQLERNGERIDPISVQGSSWDGGSHFQCHFAQAVAGATLVLTRASSVQRQRATFDFKKLKSP